MKIGLFKKNYVTPLPLSRISGYQWKTRVKIKYVDIPKGMPKSGGKNMDFLEVNAKKWKISGGHGKIDWISRGFNKSICSTWEVQFFCYGKVQFKRRLNKNKSILYSETIYSIPMYIISIK